MKIASTSQFHHDFPYGNPQFSDTSGHQAALREAQEKSLEPINSKPCTFGEEICAVWESKMSQRCLYKCKDRKLYVQGCLKGLIYAELR